ncbi:hypothetical protein VULLAG_LOCUS13079 [Vulpes lagopus]
MGHGRREPAAARRRGRCSTWPERVRHNDLAGRCEPRRTPHGSPGAERGAPCLPAR